MTGSGCAFKLFEQPAFREAAGSTLRPGGTRLTERALGLCAFPPGARVLDVGCGPGATLVILLERGLKAVGLDRSETLLEEARRARPAADGFPAALADGARLPVRSDVLDGLFCECVLSLLPDRSEALREFRRVLAPGGLLVLSDICVRSAPATLAPPRPECGVQGTQSPGGRGLERASSPFQAGSPEGRQPLWSPEAAPGPMTSCLDGAADRSAMERDLAEAGFRLLLWEDHHRLLAELAARLVFARPDPPAGERADALSNALAPGGSCDGRRFGYFLAIAAREPAEMERLGDGRARTPARQGR